MHDKDCGHLCKCVCVCICGAGWGGGQDLRSITAERVVKCNDGGGEEGGLTHRRAAAQRADWQEGEETSDQGLFIPTASSLVLSSSQSAQLRLLNQPNKLELQCKQLFPSDRTAFTTMSRGRPAKQGQTDGRKHRGQAPRLCWSAPDVFPNWFLYWDILNPSARTTRPPVGAIVAVRFPRICLRFAFHLRGQQSPTGSQKPQN